MTTALEQKWMDHYYLNFWIWGCLRDAESFLLSSANFRDVASTSVEAKDFQAATKSRIEAKDVMELEKYHFVMTMGSLLRHLNRSIPVFPDIGRAFEAAEHLRSEGTRLRNMIEHANANMEAAERGNPRKGFVRKSTAASDLPGDQPGTADATSTVVDKDGHWLGGRLNVERIIAELRILREVASAIPTPGTTRHP